MKKRNIIIIISIIILLSASILLKTYSVKEDVFIIYNDKNIKENIKKYLDLFDNYIITYSSYNYSDILSENYDALTNVAIAYILDNKDKYQKYFDTNYSYNYKDIYGNNLTCNNFIEDTYIYEITDGIFGKKDYYFINDNLQNIDNKISLIIDESKKKFNLKIENIELNYQNNLLIVKTYYKNNIIINYEFVIADGQRLTLRNVY